MGEWNPKVSIGVIALNEEAYLPRLLNDICAQEYPHELIEIVLVDSGSTDNTRQIMEAFAQNNGDFSDVVIRDNPKKILAPGWNIFLDSFTGDVAVRVDAHAQIPSDFISQNVEVLSEGEDVCGGDRPCTVPDDASNWSKVLLAAEQSTFGASIAPYRGGRNKASYVTSLFHGAYRRHVIDVVGHLNEDLRRTEDNDFYYRIRNAGFKLRLDPRIVSYQIVRTNLRSMMKQKYGNGYWIGRTLFVQPRSVGIHHLIPGIFVTTVFAGGLAALVGRPRVFQAVSGAYICTDAIMSILAARDAPRSIETLSLPLVFPLLHIGYGVGALKGLFDGAQNLLVPQK